MSENVTRTEAITKWLLVTSSVAFFFTTGFGSFSTLTQRALHWAFMGTSAFLLITAPTRAGKLAKWFLALLMLAVSVYVLATWKQRILDIDGTSSLDMVMGISATYIIAFAIFGSVLSTMGGGEWFVNVAHALTGRFRGGPAKTAVVASALMGTVSGSPVANVVTTGTFTIPLMKKVGFPAKIAGAVEAVASTGGMSLPPLWARALS